MENSMAARMRALTRLQLIDSNLDKIHHLRGSLPDEVKDLEDDLEGLEIRRQRIQTEIEKINQDISEKKGNIEDFNSQIKKYTEQQNFVKNDREYGSLNKEIEFANLEILTSEKKMRHFQEQVKMRKEQIAETDARIAEKRQELSDKQKELKHIVAETEVEEKNLLKASNEAGKLIEERLLKGYRKIRENMRNGLAVVATDRDACGGCFSIIPPQTLIELKQQTRLIHCENCGRLLMDDMFFEDVKLELHGQNLMNAS